MNPLIIDNIQAYRRAVRDTTLATALYDETRYGTIASCTEEEQRAYDGLCAVIAITIHEAQNQRS